MTPAGSAILAVGRGGRGRYPAGIAIILTCIAVNFIGDGLRDAFDTRLQRR